MCYGDVQTGSFTTGTTDLSGNRSVSIKVPAGVDAVRLQYGASSAVGSTTADFIPDGSGNVVATLPLTTTGPTYWRPLYRTSGSTVYTGPIGMYGGN